MIVQYQQYPLHRRRLRARTSSRSPGRIDRVTDETAPVSSLDPEHPIFNVPNPIGPADWDGWVQERGLYFAHTWDPAYTPLLEMADPGEPAAARRPARGAASARAATSTPVSPSSASCPAGVPGAYRLFANLLALRSAP